MKAFMKTVPLFMIILFLVAACWSNNDKKKATAEKTLDEIKKEKELLKSDLKKAGDDLDKAMEDLEDRLEKSSDAVKVALINTKKELIEQRAAIDKKMTDIETTSVDGWDEFKRDVKQISRDVDAKMKSIGEDIEETLEK